MELDRRRQRTADGGLMARPTHAALPNIMKANKKPLDKKTPTDFGVDTAPRLKILKTEEPSAARPACYKQERENTIMAILLFFWQITTTLTFPTRRPRR